MADLPSSFSYVTTVEGSTDSIVSEAQYLKLGSNDNYLKDGLDSEVTNRTSGDATLAINIGSVEDELNELQSFLYRVHDEKVYYNKYWRTGFITGSFGNERRVVAIWPEKRPGVNKTFIAIQVFSDISDDMAIDTYVEMNINASAWDEMFWVHNRDDLSIVCYFYKRNSISL